MCVTGVVWWATMHAGGSARPAAHNSFFAAARTDHLLPRGTLYMVFVLGLNLIHTYAHAPQQAAKVYIATPQQTVQALTTQLELSHRNKQTQGGCGPYI